jgi:hypothetical protein
MTRSIGAILLTALVATLGATVAPARTLPISPLDGQWSFNWTLVELKRNNAPTKYAGYNLVEFRNRQLISVLPGPVRDIAGFTTNGHVATFVVQAPPPAGLVAGKRYVMRWSVYRDRLTWSAVPGRAFIGMFLAVPWTRVK